MNSLNKEVFRSGDDKHSSFLKIKGKIQEVDKVINMINFLGEDQPEEESETEKEGA